MADSQATKADLVRHYHVPPEKITVAYPGRDENLRRVNDGAAVEAVKSCYGILGDYFLYIGTLQPRKNLVRLLRAFSNLQLPTSNFQLVLAGSKGWQYGEILAEVKRLGLESHVLFPGRIAEDDKAALLSGATALVFPSLYEGFGLPVIEAMQCGTPVICSNTSSLPEVAGEAALLVDPFDVDALTHAMLRLAEDADLCRTLVERGHAQAQKFSWRSCAASVLSALESVA
jgi:glycosyltransferase involved in cell wall biosynthesis